MTDPDKVRAAVRRAIEAWRTVHKDRRSELLRIIQKAVKEALIDEWDQIADAVADQTLQALQDPTFDQDVRSVHRAGKDPEQFMVEESIVVCGVQFDQVLAHRWAAKVLVLVLKEVIPARVQAVKDEIDQDVDEQEVLLQWLAQQEKKAN